MPGGFSYLGNFKVTDSSGEIVSSSVGSSSLLSSCADSVTIEVDSSTGKLQIPDQGANAAGGVQRDKMSKYAGFWLQGSIDKSSSAAGGAFSLENTYGSDLIVTRLIVYVETAEVSAGSCAIDVGTDSDGTSSSDNLLDGLDMKATGSTDNIEQRADGDTGTRTTAIWEDDEFIVGTLSSTGTELVAWFAVHVIDMTA